MLSTKLFNIRLYLEGLKRLKVIGMAVAILSMTISALIPIVQWMDTPLNSDRIYVIEQQQLCFPLYAVIFLAPFFFLVLFSFLHKRKESDFFHAIPYTRTCVYLSFTAAALTFVFVIMAASAATAGLIWTVNPFTTFKLGELVTLTLMCFLAAAELSAIMMLSLSLTGTPTTTMLMFALFTLLTRLIMYYLSNCLDSSLDIIYTYDIPYLGFTWFLPFGMFEYALNGAQFSNFNPFTSPANILYAIGVTLALFAAACFFYKCRKSEMAGNTAPNRVAQHIFRILFTLPFVLLIPMVLIMEDGSTELLLVLAVVSLLVYYLYELITTKRFKGFGMATLLLPVLLLSCLAFTGAYYATEWAIFANTPDDPSEVVWISIDETNTTWDDYQQYLLRDSISYDEELIKEVVTNVNQTVECDRADDYSKYFNTIGYEGTDIRWITIDFRLKNGMTITRRVAFTESHNNRIRHKYVNAIHIDEELFWSLPETNEVIDLWAYGSSKEIYTSIEFYGNYQEFYTTLLKEYDSLTIAEKDYIRTHYYYDVQDDVSFAYILRIQWKRSDSHAVYYVDLMITEDMMPKTYKNLEEEDHQRYLEEHQKGS